MKLTWIIKSVSFTIDSSTMLDTTPFRFSFCGLCTNSFVLHVHVYLPELHALAQYIKGKHTVT